MFTFKYDHNLTPRENWKLWVSFRFSDDIMYNDSPDYWLQEIVFEYNGEIKESSLSDVNTILKVLIAQ